MSSFLTVFAKHSEPKTMKLMPLNHRYSTTINYHPRNYTYANLHAATRKSKLQRIHYTSQIVYITSEWYSAAVASAGDIAINKTPLVISPTI